MTPTLMRVGLRDRRRLIDCCSNLCAIELEGFSMAWWRSMSANNDLTFPWRIGWDLEWNWRER